MELTDIPNFSSYHTTCRPSTTITVVVTLCVGEFETTSIVKYGSKYRCQTLMLLMHEQNTHIILFVFMYVFPVYFSGLIERVEEMR